MSDQTTARDRAIEAAYGIALAEIADASVSATDNVIARRIVLALLARPEVLRALAGSPDDVRELLFPTTRPPLPPVDDLALMLAAADRLWCEDTGDEAPSPAYFEAMARRLDRIVRGDLLARARTDDSTRAATAAPDATQETP